MFKIIGLILVAAVIAGAVYLQTNMFNEANCQTANIHQGGEIGSPHKMFSSDNDYLTRSDFEKDVIFFGCKIKGTI